MVRTGAPEHAVIDAHPSHNQAIAFAKKRSLPSFAAQHFAA
jgi:hypothetical protein